MYHTVRAAMGIVEGTSIKAVGAVAFVWLKESVLARSGSFHGGET
jgi:predicted acyltransferase